MTRKDYIVIANALKHSLEQQRMRLTDDTSPAAVAVCTAKIHAIEQTICDMADALAVENKCFDSQRFLEACNWHG